MHSRTNVTDIFAFFYLRCCSYSILYCGSILVSFTLLSQTIRGWVIYKEQRLLLHLSGVEKYKAQWPTPSEQDFLAETPTAEGGRTTRVTMRLNLQPPTLFFHSQHQSFHHLHTSSWAIPPNIVGLGIKFLLHILWVGSPSLAPNIHVLLTHVK